MNIVLYGVPAQTAGQIAGRYGLCVIGSPNQIGAADSLLLVPPMTTPRQLLAFYNSMLHHEEQIDAVIICGIETCEAASTVQYCSPQGKFYSLSGELEGDELIGELCLIIDSLFAEGNQINL